MSSASLDSPAPTTAGPHGASERIGVLDVLRGIALFGMYVVHFNNYAAEAAGDAPTGFMRVLESVVGLFFDGRFYTMFGILFGVGFALQLRRADARGDRFAGRFLRRLAALAVFGIIAEGVFGYNVLFGYAVWAVPLLLVRRWPVRALLVLLVVCAASRPIYNLSRVAFLGADRVNAANQVSAKSFLAARTAVERAAKADDWATVVPARLRFMPAFHRQWSMLPWGSFTLFLIGLIAFRLGLFDHPERHRRLIVTLMVAGAACWAVASWVLPIGPRPPQSLPRDISVGGMAITIARFNGFMLVRDAWLAFTYLGAVLLLVAHDRSWIRRLAPFTWTGRMALTNYMMQVILLDSLFTPHGLGRTVTPFMVPVGALVLFVAQAALSRWWLARYRLGPLEWLWRSATYWRWQPMRNAPGVVEGAVAAA
jgi:uncharacterized protein